MERRAFLTGAAKAGVAVAAGFAAPLALASPTADRSAWNAAMVRYLDAKAASDRFDDEVFEPFSEELTRRFGSDAWRTSHGINSDLDRWCKKSGYEAAVMRVEDLSTLASDAKWELLTMPAPDLAALRFKLEDLASESDGIIPYTGDYVAVLLADCRRLLPTEA